MSLAGAVEMAEDCFGIPVRLGVPAQVGGLREIVASPIYAAGAGLVLFGMSKQDRTFIRPRDDNMLAKVKNRMSDWLSEFF